MRIFLKGSILLFCFLSSIWAGAQQFPSEVWHDGLLINNENDTLRGKIKYDQEGDVVQVQTRRVIKTYGARNLSYFQIFDATANYHRFFYSIPFSVKNPNYRVPLLFEVLHEGELTLLSREAIVSETLPQYNSYYRSSYSRQKLQYTYYFLRPNKKIFEYTGKKNDLLEVMKDKQSEIKRFIKKNRLKSDRRSDLIRIVTYYNELIQS